MFELGVTITLPEVILPGFHVYELAPEALMVNEFPLQTAELDATAVMVGIITPTLTVCAATQMLLAAFTVNTVVDVSELVRGLLIFGLLNSAEGDQLKVAAGGVNRYDTPLAGCPAFKSFGVTVLLVEPDMVTQLKLVAPPVNPEEALMVPAFMFP